MCLAFGTGTSAVCHSTNPAGALGLERETCKSPKSYSRLHNIDIFGIRGARRARFSDPANSPKSYSRLHNINIFGIRCVRRAHFLLPTGTSKREPRNGNLQTEISKRGFPNENTQTGIPKSEPPNGNFQTGINLCGATEPAHGRCHDGFTSTRSLRGFATGAN